MEELLLADKYAQVLIAVAEEADLVEVLDTELTMFGATVAQQPRLREVLLSPMISFKEKEQLLESAFKGQGVSPEFVNFLYFLLKVKRFNLFSEISKIYKDLIYSLRKRLKVVVESALALDTGQKQALKEKLSSIYQRKIELSVEVNPNFLGGAKVSVGHTLYDGTIKTRLGLLRESICKE